MRKSMLSLVLGCAISVQAQLPEHGLVGFAAMPGYGLEGTVGGGLGEIVRVTDEEELRRYCAAEKPYTILFEGTIVSENEQDIEVASDKTIIGLHANAVLEGIGFRADGVHNVVIRGFAIRNAHQDAIAFRASHHVWVDHCDLGSSDDGLLDFTMGSDLMTASWNRFHDHNKVSVCNSGTQHYEDVGRQNVSYHHNAFIRTTQRNPRIGYGRGHVWNNYYEEVRSYCVGYFTGAQVRVEQNSFCKSGKPLNQMYTHDSTSAHYGRAEEIGNLFVDCKGSRKGTGRVFDAGAFYDYAMALDESGTVSATVKGGAGPVGGLEYDLIPLPNHGRIGYPHADGVLRWSKAPGTVAYHVYLASSREALDEGCLGRVDSNAIEVRSLKASAKYYWRVDVQLADTLRRGAVWQFVTAPDRAGNPFPADGDARAQLRAQLDERNTQPLTLAWSPALGAEGYRVTLIDSTGGKCYSAEVGKHTTTWQPPALRQGRQYTWRVEPVPADGAVVEKVAEWTFSSPIAEAKEGVNELENWTLGLRSFVEVQDGSWFSASGGKVVCGEAGPGTMSAEWRGGAVKADIALQLFDESDGAGCYKLFVNEELRGDFAATANADSLVTVPVCTTTLETGDQLRLEISPEGGESCRTDFLRITVTERIGER